MLHWTIAFLKSCAFLLCMIGFLILVIFLVLGLAAFTAWLNHVGGVPLVMLVIVLAIMLFVLTLSFGTPR